MKEKDSNLNKKILESTFKTLEAEKFTLSINYRRKLDIINYFEMKDFCTSKGSKKKMKNTPPSKDIFSTYKQQMTKMQ